MAGARERDTVERFRQRYRLASGEVTRQIERAVIGGDWGANGYTTLAQADRLGEVLGLDRGSVLLDLGAGRGWPGLYLASTTGCRVVMADVPAEPLEIATARAGAEGLSQRAKAVRCSARDLPFARSSFDAVVHTDVLCWLRPKLSVLRACARLLRPGGRTAFFTIHPAEGLSPRERRRAARDGPPAVSVARSHRELLEAAGFMEVAEADCSDEFVTVTQAWFEQWEIHRREMEELLGPEVVEERQRERRAYLPTTQARILRRSLFIGRRP